MHNKTKIRNKKHMFTNYRTFFQSLLKIYFNIIILFLSFFTFFFLKKKKKKKQLNIYIFLNRKSEL